MSRIRLRFLVVFLASLLPAVLMAEEPAEDEERDKAVYQRFLTVLEKNSREGTAFDKVYAYHLERGSLERFLNSYRKVASTTSDASAWMVIGLMEVRRGQDDLALEAFRKAESLDDSNPLASFHVGRVLVDLNKSDEAAQAFERAIERKPAPSDQLTIFQALGRVYQRSQKPQQALKVWNRLEESFPDDRRVQEQIAAILLEEGDYKSALPRYEKLVLNTKDRYQQSLFRLEVAEIKVRLNRKAEALDELEKLVAELSPDSWLHRETRRRIDNIFLRTDDQKGLIAYYERALAKSPDDLDLFVRVARLFASAGRAEEATKLLERGLVVAPSNKELRRSLIQQHLSLRQFGLAAAQFELLNKYDPQNPDTLRDWGRTVLKDTTREQGARKRDVAAVWRQLLAIRPNDSTTAAQVADLFRHAEMVDEALELYRHAIELSPEATQYREYLGEYLHVLKRSDEARAAWREITAGSRLTASNAARLSEVCSRFGYLEEAIQAGSDACRLDPGHFNYQLKQADLLCRFEKYAQSLRYIDSAKKLAATEEDRENCLNRELSALQATKQLGARVIRLRTELSQPQLATERLPESERQRLARLWYWLARASETMDDPSQAFNAIEQARKLDARSVSILNFAARILETRREFSAAVEINRTLAQIAPRMRLECLKRLVSLETKLGHKERALQAGRDLIAAAPGNPEICEFFSNLCFRLGRPDEGIQALRRLLRISPGDLEIMNRLAVALSEHGQTQDAIEILWQAFDRATRLEDRVTIVQNLAQSHARTGQLDRLYSRLERDIRDPARQRDVTLCLAAAYEVSKDNERAQKTLETLLSSDTRDAELLIRLSKLAERRNRPVDAIQYQRQAFNITGDKADRIRLSQLMIQLGDINSAIELLMDVGTTKELTPDVLILLDSLYAHRQNTPLVAQLETLRRKYPDNWELLYREGVVLSDTIPAQAAARFEALLKLNCSDDEPSLMARGTQRIEPSGGAWPLFDRMAELPLILTRVQLLGGTSLISVQRTGRATLGSGWWPQTFGTARLATWGWILKIKGNSRDPAFAFVDKQIAAVEQSSTTRSMLDRLAIYSFLGEHNKKLEAARQLARGSANLDGAALFLSYLAERNVSPAILPQAGSPLSKIAPLDPQILSEATGWYHDIVTQHGPTKLNIGFMGSLSRELLRANRREEALKLLDLAIDQAYSSEGIAALLRETDKPEYLRQTAKLLEKLIASERNSTKNSSVQTWAAISGVVAPDVLAERLQSSFLDSQQPVDELLRTWELYVQWHAVASQIAPPRGRTFRVSRIRYPTPRTVLIQGPVPGAGINGVTTFQFNRPNEVCYEGMVLLASLHEQFRAANRVADLMSALQERSNAPAIPTGEQLLWKNCYSYVLWNEGQHAESAVVFPKLDSHDAEWTNQRLDLAMRIGQAGDKAKALEIVGRTTAVDEHGLQMRRESIVVDLALALGKTDRARESLRQLQKIKIPANELIPYAQQMFAMKMYDDIKEMFDVDSNLRTDIRGLEIIMQTELALGLNDRANDSAKVLLRTVNISSPSSITSPQGSAQVVLQRPQPVNLESYRTAALKVLNATGELTRIIGRLEMELATSPDSESVVASLIIYHKFLGNQEQYKKLLQRQIEIEQDKPANRYAAAIKHLEANQTEEAVDHIRIVLEKQPAYFAAHCRDLVYRFELANELGQLANMLEKADWHQLEQHPEALPYVIEKLEETAATRDFASRLFLKEWNDKPDGRLPLLLRLTPDSLWKLPEIAESLRRLPLPKDPSRLQEKQWELFGHELRRELNGTVVITALNRILDTVAGHQQLDTMALEVEQAIQKEPGWIAGKILRNLIDLRRGRIEEACHNLQKVDGDLVSHMRANPFAAWEIARELSPYDQGFEALLQYHRLAILGCTSIVDSTHKPGSLTPTKREASVRAIAQSLARRERSTDARRLLLESLPVSVRQDGKVQVLPTGADLQMVEWIGQELKSMGFTADAIEIYLLALDRSQKVRIDGYDSRVVVRNTLVVAFGELSPPSFVRTLELRQQENRSLGVHVFVSRRTSVSHLETRWSTVLGSLANDPGLLRRAQAALEGMRRGQPDNPDPEVLRSVLACECGNEDELRESAAALLRITRRIESPSKPAAAQDLIADHVDQQRQGGLWILARECLKRDALKDIGQQLAESALQINQPDGPVQRTILTEWIALATAAKDEALVDRLRSELTKLKSATAP